MSEIEAIASQIHRMGFQCQRCGACCRGEGLRVMVYPAEVRAIAAHCGALWEEVAEPYPEEVVLPSGQRCTFEWALRTKNGACIFSGEGRCHIYSCRPWICRTYPFVLAGKKLLSEECPGLGKAISDAEAHSVAHDLIRRREVEKEEEDRVSVHGRDLDGVEGCYILVDGEGVKILEP
jgi:Fe-S-cluster containining protein